MASRDLDPEQAVSIAAVLLFLNAAFLGFPLLQGLTNAGTKGLVLSEVALVAALIAAGVGLLRGRRWAWFLALVTTGLLAVFDLLALPSFGALFSLFFNGIIIWVLVQQRVRSRFGVR